MARLTAVSESQNSRACAENSRCSDGDDRPKGFPRFFIYYLGEIEMAKSKTEIIKIEQTCSGYQLTIDGWFIDTYGSIEKLLTYLGDRVRSDFP